MDESRLSFGQPDVVRFSGEDAAAGLLEKAIDSLWDVVSQLGIGTLLEQPVAK